MRLLITEFICGGGFANQVMPESLQQEGQMMLQALLDDCSTLPDCDVMITLDERISLTTHGCEVKYIADANDYINRVTELSKEADYVWVVAPEKNDILEIIIRRLEGKSVNVINCDADSIRLCADKLTCTQHLEKASVNAVPTLSVDALRSHYQKVLLKPRQGVGCEQVQVFSSGLSAMNFIKDPDYWIAQPYVQGTHCSMSLLCYAGEAIILTCNQQELSNLTRPTLNKCIVNAFPATEELTQMASQVARTFPGLSGYVGIDFIQTKHACMLVEVNPRLTTSYIGLQQALQQNPALLCLDTIIKQELTKSIELANPNIEVDIAASL